MSTDPSLVPPGTLPTTYIQTTGTSAGSVGYMVMSYPGRPPMVPGIPMPPTMGMPYMPIGAPPPLMPGVMPMGPMMGGPPLPPMPPQIRQYRPPTVSAAPKPRTTTPTTVSAPAVRATTVPDGPVVTVFVGNITEKAPDQMIRFVLSACGHVTSWKRVQAFGFCEYGNPDAGLRAIRLLHDYEISGKKLVVRVDAKTKTVLDEYKNEKRKKTRSGSPLQDEAADEEDYMDEEMKSADKAALERISMILSDYETEMKNYIAPSSADENSKTVMNKSVDMERKLKTQEKLAQLTQASENRLENNLTLDLADANIEEDRRDLITREIGKFREIMKGEASL